jgi:hypothetical protein
LIKSSEWNAPDSVSKASLRTTECNPVGTHNKIKTAWGGFLEVDQYSVCLLLDCGDRVVELSAVIVLDRASTTSFIAPSARADAGHIA